MIEIRELTKDCPREDCSVSCLGTTVTLMGWAPMYYMGNRTYEGDPNASTSVYRCHTCRQSWAVWEQCGQIEIASLEMTR